MKRTKGIYLALLVVLLSPMANADAIVVGTLVNDGDGTPGTVDFVEFTQNTDGTTSFDMLSSEAFPTFFDTMIWLFAGTPSVPNLITENDDWGGVTDGSTSSLDSFLSVFLTAGSYTLAVGMCCDFGATDIVDGTQTYTYFYDQTYAPSTSGDYQLTITGDVTLASVPEPAPVPEPATLALLGLGLAGMAARRRKKV